jgi:tetratricopeptide (TPR) repeat protein
MFANIIHQEGHDFMIKGDYLKAIDCFSMALLQHPDHADIYSDRGVSYLHLKMETEAMADFNYALKLQPDYGYRYAARAYAKDFFGDTEAAIEDYEKAIELDPEDAVSYNNIGLLQEKKGYKVEAQKNFERADKLSKMENRLYDLMDQLEEEQPEEISSVEPKTLSIEETPVNHEMIDPATIREKNISTFKEFTQIFKSKKQFNEFMRFLKNGLRIK